MAMTIPVSPDTTSSSSGSEIAGHTTVYSSSLQHCNSNYLLEALLCKYPLVKLKLIMAEGEDREGNAAAERKNIPPPFGRGGGGDSDDLTTAKQYTPPGTSSQTGKERGLIAATDIPRGTVIVNEAAFVWQVEPTTTTQPSQAQHNNLMWNSSSLLSSSSPQPTVADKDTLLLQMAPYALSCASISTSSPSSSSLSSSSSFPLFDVVQATMAANSFGVKWKQPTTTYTNAIISTAETTETTTEEEEAVKDVVDARALFSIVCLANHSCAPSASASQVMTVVVDDEKDHDHEDDNHKTDEHEQHAEEVKEASSSSSSSSSSSTGTTTTTTAFISNAPRFAITARRDIRKGEEITISYIPRSWTKDKRKQALQSTYGFECVCERCNVPYDDTRVMRCSAVTKKGDDIVSLGGKKVAKGKQQGTSAATLSAGGGSNKTAVVISKGNSRNASSSSTLQCLNGRVYLGSDHCIDCKAKVPYFDSIYPASDVSSVSTSATASLPAAASLARLKSLLQEAAKDDILAPILDAPLGVDELTNALLDHPLLAHEDERIFSSLCSLLSAITPEAEAEDDDEGVYHILYARLASAIASAATGTPYTSPFDLGIEI